MFGKLFLVIAVLGIMVRAQTFEWVDVTPLDIQTNPTYLKGTVALDNDGNPVCARLINYKQLYSLSYLGDVRIEKRNPSGLLLWENIISGKAEVSELILDGENSTICTGIYKDTLAIDTFLLVHTGSGAGNFILKLDSSGNPVWLKEGTEFFSGNYEFSALSRDGLNNILAGITDYPSGTKILKLDQAGNIISTIVQTNVGTISDIAQDLFNNIWVTGFTSTDNQSFNGLDTIAPFTYTEYVVKYNSSETAEWVTFIEDITVQDFNIETDGPGNAYLSGNLFDSTSFGNLHAAGPQWVYDYFITKISPDGNFIWLKEIPPGNTSGDATVGNSGYLSCSPNGDTYITGFIRGEIDFGNGITVSAQNYYDVFIVSYNTSGEVQWAKTAGSSTHDIGSSIVADGTGDCYLTGIVSENSVFDTISVPGGYVNLYFAKLDNDNIVSGVNNSSDDDIVINDFRLYQNYPNPFNPETRIQYAIDSQQYVTLKVYNVLGNEVATLVNDFKAAGKYEINFDGSRLTSGIYFYVLKGGNYSATKKMILLK